MSFLLVYSYTLGLYSGHEGYFEITVQLNVHHHEPELFLKDSLTARNTATSQR